MIENAILIAGPTASGKSALAVQFAEQRGGVVVNTDSMQVYDVLNILTARPGNQDLARVPHHLYGHVDPADSYSVAAWVDDVIKLSETVEAGRSLVFTGGTGLYFRALTDGIANIPKIPPEIREALRRRFGEEGAASLYLELQKTDPEAAARIRPADGQRIVRALEVFSATGKTISYWKSQPARPLIDRSTVSRHLVLPDRKILSERISTRFDLMIDAGALEEVRALLAMRIDPLMPAMKAIGVREISEYLDGQITLAEAVARAKTATRQYAKRQMTWFRNQTGPDWILLP